jgi:TctA family transporter
MKIAVSIIIGALIGVSPLGGCKIAKFLYILTGG